MQLQLALRNLTRRKSRTILTAITIMLGVMMMLLSIGYNNGIDKQMTDLVTRNLTGDLLVQPQDAKFYDVFKPAKANGPVIPSLADTRSKLGAVEGVEQVAPRNRVGGLMRTSESDVGLIMIGVLADAEAAFNKHLQVIEGESLSASAPQGVLISDTIAKEQKLKVGDTAVWTSSDKNGAMQEKQLTIRGIYEGDAYTSNQLFAGIGLSQQVLGLKADEAQELAVILKENSDTEAAKTAVADAAKSGSLPVQVFTWQEKGGFFSGIVLGNGVSFGVMVGILFVAIIFGLMNSVVMTIKERTGEIGAMMAMGTPGGQILRQLMLEQTWLTGIAALIGIGLSYGLISWLGQVGIPAPAPAIEFAFGGKALYLTISWVHLALTFVTALAVALLATLFSGYSIVRMKPVDALRELS
ncbi:ABC transporter permease [Tumebacillus sp. DT12]|uniref:ABC transporter permease n=1 Tax=Tumebacillus lacus TaxID=2995335 RepID=A0ABT3X4H2_9BACL|nr:ABC transporter permease [Tumebacillus lacus]MCX7571785.1 ABC transporter permease [Tumebacillus lacus]